MDEIVRIEMDLVLNYSAAGALFQWVTYVIRASATTCVLAWSTRIRHWPLNVSAKPDSRRVLTDFVFVSVCVFDWICFWQLFLLLFLSLLLLFLHSFLCFPSCSFCLWCSIVLFFQKAFYRSCVYHWAYYGNCVSHSCPLFLFWYMRRLLICLLSEMTDYVMSLWHLTADNSSATIWMCRL